MRPWVNLAVVESGAVDVWELIATLNFFFVMIAFFDASTICSHDVAWKSRRCCGLINWTLTWGNLDSLMLGWVSCLHDVSRLVSVLGHALWNSRALCCRCLLFHFELVSCSHVLIKWSVIGMSRIISQSLPVTLNTNEMLNLETSDDVTWDWIQSVPFIISCQVCFCHSVHEATWVSQSSSESTLPQLTLVFMIPQPVSRLVMHDDWCKFSVVLTTAVIAIPKQRRALANTSISSKSHRSNQRVSRWQWFDLSLVMADQEEVVMMGLQFHKDRKPTQPWTDTLAYSRTCMTTWVQLAT